MTDPTNFWTDVTSAQANRHDWVARGTRDLANWDAAHQPPPDPEPATPDVVADLDLIEYAQQRDALGIRSAGEFVGLDRRHVEDSSGFPNAGDRLTREQLAAMTNPYRVHQRPGEAPRQRGIDASMVESLGGLRGRGVVS
jgi:hypothetical protein